MRQIRAAGACVSGYPCAALHAANADLGSALPAALAAMSVGGRVAGRQIWQDSR